VQSVLFDPPRVWPQLTDNNDELELAQLPSEFHSMAQARNLNVALSSRAFGLILSTSVAKYTASVTIDQLVLHIRLVAQFQQWQSSFEQFLAANEHTWTRQEANAANVLYAQHLSMYIWMAPCLFPEETAFDVHRPEFERILQLASETIRDGHGCENICHSVGNFQFDMGLIPPLHLAGSKCRWPDLRREFLRILGSAHWREGMFDSYRSYKYVYEIMLVEEAVMDGLEESQDALFGDLDLGVTTLPPEAARIHQAELGPLEPGASWQRLTLVSKPNGVLAPPVSWITFISTSGEFPLPTPYLPNANALL
jgi:hypothetical protein